MLDRPSHRANKRRMGERNSERTGITREEWENTGILSKGRLIGTEPCCGDKKKYLHWMAEGRAAEH